MGSRPHLGAEDEAAAFTVLFDQHARAVYGFCFRMTANQTLAEDLMSVTFLEAWRRRRVTVRTERARAWLFGIAHNVVRNQNRSMRRHYAALARVERPSADPDFADDVTTRVSHEEAAARALATLRTLPRGERDVIALVAWSGLTVSEAAVALGIAEGTARTRLFRARKRLGGDSGGPLREAGATEGARNAR